MGEPYHRILLVFLDGVGLAPATSGNPLARVPTPALASLLGGPLTRERVGSGRGLLLAPLDARLGVEGLPQSATGQTALFTGVNAPALLGRHSTGFVGPRLAETIERSSLFAAVRERGRSATFANAYGRRYRQAIDRGRRRPSVTTLAVLAAGLPLRGVEELARGEAVSWDVERDRFAELSGEAVPAVPAREAGRHLAALARGHRLTVYETFLTDLAGHRRWGVTAAEALARVDGLLAGVLEADDPELTLVVTSDHGNLEDETTRGHTLNPVPLLVRGPLAERFAEVSSLLEVAPCILRCLA